MKYAITFPNAGPIGDPRNAGEMAAVAEEAGWDAVFLEDYIVHHVEPGRFPTYDPWISLAMIAARTSKVRVGITVTPLCRRRPWKVAREALSIDHLSGGRMILGVGTGAPHMDWSFSRFGEAIADKVRAQMVDEGLEIIIGLWSGKPFSYEGKHYRIKDVTFVPTPLQKPRIPIWVGGAWPNKGPIRRAARFDCYSGYRTYPDGPLSPDDIRDVRSEIQRHRKSAAPFELAGGGWPRTDDPEALRARIRACEQAGLTWWCEYAFGQPDQVRQQIKGGPIRAD